MENASAACQQTTSTINLIAKTLTRETIQANIMAEVCYNAFEGYLGSSAINGNTVTKQWLRHDDCLELAKDGLRRMSLCFLTLRNGFTVVGTAHSMGVDDYDFHVNIHYAREAAIAQLWPIMANELRSQLYPRTGVYPMLDLPLLDVMVDTPRQPEPATA